jgi:signal transduction histidine kinase
MNDARILIVARDRPTRGSLGDLDAALFNALPDPIVMMDEDRRILRCNARLLERVGRSEDQLTGRECHAALCGGGHPADVCPLGEALRENRSDPKPPRLSLWGRHYDLRSAPLIDRDGRPWGAIDILRDITEQVDLEARLRQTQKFESIGRLAAGIAHEINTPMQYVADNACFLRDTFHDMIDLLGRYRRLLEEVERGPAEPETLDGIRGALKRADVDYLAAEIPQAIEQSLAGVGRVVRIVRAMREFSHPGVPKKASIDLNRAVESAVEISRNEWKRIAEVRLELAPDLPPIDGYPGEVNQALLNLIINAAHAVGDVVAGDGSVKGLIRAVTRHVGDGVLVQIADTGSGIAPEIRDRIFDPFFTTKDPGKGTGQGLAIVRSIVEKHRGRVEFETELGKGTTFSLWLPLRSERAADASAGLNVLQESAF